MKTTQWYLGQTKGPNPESVYLSDFEWQCGWYWAGGYIGNSKFHAHFDGAFLEVPDHRGHCLGNFNPEDVYNGCSVWEPLSKFLDNAQYTERQWWRIKDLFKQFYVLKQAAEVFQYGGHCTTDDRTPGELNPEMAKTINAHIQTIIIPAIQAVMNKTEIEK